MVFKQITWLLKDHLFDSHPKCLTKLLGVLSDNIVRTIVKSCIKRYFIQITFDFLKNMIYTKLKTYFLGAVVSIPYALHDQIEIHFASNYTSVVRSIRLLYPFSKDIKKL